MSAEDSLSTRQLGMVSEAARRHAAREAGIAHDAPEAPQVVGVQPAEAPGATHDVTVRHEDSEAIHHSVYGVNTETEYLRRHTQVNASKTKTNSLGKALVTTKFTP